MPENRGDNMRFFGRLNCVRLAESYLRMQGAYERSMRFECLRAQTLTTTTRTAETTTEKENEMERRINRDRRIRRRQCACDCSRCTRDYCRHRLRPINTSQQLQHRPIRRRWNGQYPKIAGKMSHRKNTKQDETQDPASQRQTQSQMANTFSMKYQQLHYSNSRILFSYEFRIIRYDYFYWVVCVCVCGIANIFFALQSLRIAKTCLSICRRGRRQRIEIEVISLVFFSSSLDERMANTIAVYFRCLQKPSQPPFISNARVLNSPDRGYVSDSN